MNAQQEKIRKAYIEYVLLQGRQPESVFAFAKKLKMSEEEFYEHYNSFTQIEGAIWRHLITDSVRSLQAEEVYTGYSVREKLLGFYFTLVETMRKNRSYLLKAHETLNTPLATTRNPQLADAKMAFKEFAADLVVEGRDTREIEQRLLPQLMQQYPELLWLQTIGIIEFWIHDDSRGFEKTDTLIEKSVNTAMDWLGRTPFDSLLDLGKFIFQNRR